MLVYSIILHFLNILYNWASAVKLRKFAQRNHCMTACPLCERCLYAHHLAIMTTPPRGRSLSVCGKDCRPSSIFHGEEALPLSANI